MKLKNKRKIESGKIFNAYFKAKIYEAFIDKKIPKADMVKGGITGENYSTYLESVRAFRCNGKEYAIISFDHFNGHFSGFKDPAAIFGIEIAEIVEVTN